MPHNYTIPKIADWCGGKTTRIYWHNSGFLCFPFNYYHILFLFLPSCRQFCGTRHILITELRVCVTDTPLYLEAELTAYQGRSHVPKLGCPSSLSRGPRPIPLETRGFGERRARQPNVFGPVWGEKIVLWWVVTHWQRGVKELCIQTTTYKHAIESTMWTS